ncbi:MAG: low molecular weight protein arginine phosphatase [Clostridia bacterium]|nr:low molecular weight protein arginine phosphatase [Clostridia bacterium]
MDIVFVCTGNTCRSPMAEGMFRALGGEEKLGMKAASAGMFAHNGMCATPYAVEAMKEYGADLSMHQARQITPEIVANAKYLFCATAAHYDHLIQMYPEAESKTYLLMQTDVNDPFGGNLLTYRACAAQIHEGMQTLIAQLEGKNA